MPEIEPDNKSPLNLDGSSHERMKPLDYHDLVIESLNLVEIFKPEDYEELERGLDNLYSTIFNTSNLKNLFPTVSARKDEYKEFIAKSGKSMTAGSWLNLHGFSSRILAETNPSVRSQYPIMELPCEVTLLHLSLYHLLPSIIMLVAQFDFTDAVSDSLNRILAEEQYEGSVIFGGREGHIPPERVKAKKVNGFLLDLQRSLEEFICRHFAGVFLSQKGNPAQSYKCPSTILYSLRAIPLASNDELVEWVSHQHRFINILGYSNITPTIYQHANKYLLLTFPDYHYENTPLRTAILASRDRFIGNETWMRLILDDRLIALQAIDYIMELYSKKIINHRNCKGNYDIGISSNFWKLRKNFISCYAQKGNIDYDYFDFTKINRELTSITANSHWIKDNVHEYNAIYKPKERPDFGYEIVEHIKADAARIDTEFSLHKERLSDTFTSINTLSNYINSAWMFWLTMALVFLTIILAIIGLGPHILDALNLFLKNNSGA